jgi:hypothetical protein
VSALQRYLVQFLRFQQHLGTIGRFIALNPVVLGNFFPGFGVYLLKTYAIAGIPIDDVEADSLFR